MKKNILAALAITLAAFLSIQNASAHVGWQGRDLMTDATSSTVNPNGSTTYVYDRGNVTSNFGWADGLTGAMAPNPAFDDWGDSHRVRSTKFYLGTASYVDLTVSALDYSRNTANDDTVARLGDLNPGFSIYSGGNDPLNAPTAGQPWRDHNLVPQSSFDWPAASAGPGAPQAHQMGKEGLFVANGDITMANNAGEINTQYFTGDYASNLNGNSVSLNGLLLDAGWYAVIVGGAKHDAIEYATNLNDRNPNFHTNPSPNYAYLGAHADLDNGVRGFGVELTVKPVPVPGAVWLFGSAIAGLIGFGKRKRVV